VARSGRPDLGDLAVLSRRLGGPLSLLVLPAALAASMIGAPARAAEPVTFDATVTVEFTEAAIGFDLAGDPIAGAQVGLVARIGGAEPAVQSLAATTGAAGTATFDGVARSTGDTPVLLAIEASRTTGAPIGGCSLTETRYGGVGGVVSEPIVAVDLVGFLSSSTACPPGGPLPPGIVADGVVLVTVVGGATAIPLPSLNLTLSATAGGVPFQSLAATTDDDGRATFEGVGRPTANAEVTLAAAVADSTMTLVDGCAVTHHWSGSGREPGAAGTVAIVVPAGLATTIACAPPGPDSPVLTGAIRDASGDAVPVATAWLAMTRSDGARWIGRIEPGANGSFATRLQAWGSDDDPATLEIRVQGAPTATRTAGDCIHTDGPVGRVSLDVALEGGFDPDPVTVVAEIGERSSVCGIAAAPAPGGGSTGAGTPTPGGSPAAGALSPASGPSITLPPTDAADALGRAVHEPLLPALVAVLGALALAVGWAVAGRDA